MEAGNGLNATVEAGKEYEAVSYTHLTIYFGSEQSRRQIVEVSQAFESVSYTHLSFQRIHFFYYICISLLKIEDL